MALVADGIVPVSISLPKVGFSDTSAAAAMSDTTGWDTEMVRQKQQLIHRTMQSELNSMENAMCVTQLLADASNGTKNKQFPYICNDFISTMTRNVKDAKDVWLEYAETRLLSEKDATVLVQAFLVFTGNLLVPPAEMAIFFDGSGDRAMEMNLRHAWITLIFTKTGQAAMRKGCVSMESEHMMNTDQHDVTDLMVQALRKGELYMLLQHSLSFLPEQCWLTAAQRRACQIVYKDERCALNTRG